MSKGPRVPRPEPGRFYENHTAAPSGPVTREMEDMAKAVGSISTINVRIGQTPEQAIEDEVAAAMLRTSGSSTKRNRRAWYMATKTQLQNLLNGGDAAALDEFIQAAHVAVIAARVAAREDDRESYGESRSSGARQAWKSPNAGNKVSGVNPVGAPVKPAGVLDREGSPYWNIDAPPTLIQRWQGFDAAGKAWLLKTLVSKLGLEDV